MKFYVIEDTYTKQGTDKAFCDCDEHGRYYWFPRSQVKVLERIEPQSKYDVAHLHVEIPDWLIRKNLVPVFRLTALVIDR